MSSPGNRMYSGTSDNITTGMDTKQPQTPEEAPDFPDNFAAAIILAGKNRREWIQYAKSLEQENIALKEKTASLEKQVFMLKQSVNEYARFHPMSDSNPVYPEVPEREDD